MSSDPAPEPGAPGQQEPSGKAGEAAGQRRTLEPQRKTGEMAYLKRSPIFLMLIRPAGRGSWLLSEFSRWVPSSLTWFGDRSSRPTSCRLPTTPSMPLVRHGAGSRARFQPFSGLFIPSVKAKKAQSTAMAAHAKHAQVVAATSQVDAAVADPAAAAQQAEKALQTAAAAQKDAAVAQKEHHHSQANRAVLMWATAAVLAMLACASLGIFLLRSIETPGAVNGSTASASVRSSSAAPSAPSPAKDPNRLLDLLVTGLVVGAGTKPLHDLISQIQTTFGQVKGQRLRHNDWLTAGHMDSPGNLQPCCVLY